METDLSDNPVMQQQAEDRQREMERFNRRRRNRMILSIIGIVLLSVIAVAACYYVFEPDAMLALLEEYWPVLMAPFAGWLLGSWTVRSLYHPSGKIVVSVDTESHMFRAVFIPDAMFRYFDQSGNNVLYHSILGMPVYLAENIDTESGIIEYSWIHELGSIEVMTREQTYNNWRSTLEEVLRENLELMDHPHVIGLGYARKCLKDQLDLIAGTLGLNGRDFAHDDSVTYPEPGEGSDEQGHRLHQGHGARPDHSRRFG